MTPILNILIRHKKGREQFFERCINSIITHEYPVRIIVSVESCESKIFVSNSAADKIILVSSKNHYNLHCNDLIKEVQEGWFMFMDDDDYLRPGSLTEIEKYLQEEDGDYGGLIVQFLRGNIRKPTDRLMKNKIIQKGVIGGGCLILHSRHKNIAKWEPQLAADYEWIKEISEYINLKWVPTVVQIAGNNGLKGK